MSINNYYAVKVGRVNNTIVRSWSKCSALVTGHPGAVFKGFRFEEEAAKYLGVLTSLPNQRAQGRAQDIQDVCKSRPSKSKPHKRKSFWDEEKFPCTMRGDYMHNGFLRKNRCIMRSGPTVTGEDYIPSSSTSVPWN